MTKGKKYWCDTDFSGTCSMDDDVRRNQVTSSGSVCVDINRAFEPVGAHGGGCGTSNVTINPFVLAPGAMHGRTQWANRVATVLGDVGTFDASKQSIPILSSDADISKIRPDWAFRLEFVGDAIIDCGHNPLRSEIHPPSNVLMHLSTPDMVHVKRYSLEGWDRGQLGGTTAAVPFDLWPGPPEPGKTNLAYRIVFPTGNAGPSSNLDCRPYPTVSPDRIRCVVKKGTVSGDTNSCLSSNSNRLFASCATAIGGGIVDVYWE